MNKITIVAYIVLLNSCSLFVLDWNNKGVDNFKNTTWEFYEDDSSLEAYYVFSDDNTGTYYYKRYDNLFNRPDDNSSKIEGYDFTSFYYYVDSRWLLPGTSACYISEKEIVGVDELNPIELQFGNGYDRLIINKANNNELRYNYQSQNELVFTSNQPLGRIGAVFKLKE